MPPPCCTSELMAVVQVKWAEGSGSAAKLDLQLASKPIDVDKLDDWGIEVPAFLLPQTSSDPSG